MSVVKIEDAFTEAAARGDVKTLTALLEQGANVNETDKEGYSALQVAAKKRRLEAKEGYSALQVAAKKRRLEAVEYLLQSGADVNQRDSDGFSALHEAAFNGDADIVRVLLKAGANKTFVTSEGTTALAIAVRHGHGVVTHLLADGHSLFVMAHEDDGGGDGDRRVPLRWYLHIAYYGTGLVGWQRQLETSSSGLGSVQELVEDAVTEAFAATERINVTSASRTDAGTHALYQFATIKVPTTAAVSSFDELQRELNERLPESVRILKVASVPSSSVRILKVASVPSSVRPSRFRSKYKKYVYYIQQGHRPDLELGKYSWFLGRRLDIGRLREALQHMVRRIIGTVRPIAEGTYPASRMLAVLNGELEPGPSAPTKGLWLHRTWLTQEDWDNDETKHE
ncbi:hypothetical protein P43SY_008859 [Pythium insidiosum]|uniref:tRNA pseudouridine synthase n=1 Tax=Pythium insidiosum TaxID=114742 RepID=A0AAD5M9D3_PYTIN|nr:hypothetical protein P43SY_008859 [Pythium insidiosum]